ncbi:MAG: hypothetical protein AABM67_01490 [Acidobacteriota bacterium]
MGLEKQTMAEALVRARNDLARRLKVNEHEIKEGSVEQADFPDAALGAPIEDEMSAQVITPGSRIRLIAKGQTYEYRTNGRQLRLVNFDGENYRI